MTEALTGLIKFLCSTGNVFHLASRFLNTISQESINNLGSEFMKSLKIRIFILMYLKTIIKGVGVFLLLFRGGYAVVIFLMMES